MAKRRRKRRTSKPQPEYPGWVWMLFGLSIGLSVAFAIYMKDREASGQARAVTPAAAARVADESTEAEVPVPEEPPERRFDFYDMLPNFEVIIPEREPDVRKDLGPQAIEQPGLYVLQAGSFTEYGDADRRRAQLALQGIESRIQRVTIDDHTYHRVRIGPTRDLDHLNLTRRRLHEAGIDVLRIRLSD